MALEFISPEGFRTDGRRPGEIRAISASMGLFHRADGSALFQQGNTQVLATVYGPREVEVRARAKHDEALVTCEYSMATFSTGERRKGSSGGNARDRRSKEISLVIKKTFEGVILTDLFPHSQIDIYVQVLQADGGTRCAAINATTLALIDAGIPMSDFVVSCAAGYIDGTPLLDLNYVEDSADGPDMPVAILPESGKVTMLQMDSRLALDTFESVLNLAVEGCHKINDIMVNAVKDHAGKLIASRGTFSN